MLILCVWMSVVLAQFVYVNIVCFDVGCFSLSMKCKRLAVHLTKAAL